MRLTFDPRALRLLRAMPRTSLYAVSELLLLLVLAWQVARLFWAIVTPVSPLGDWRPAGAATGGGGVALGAFDPFFRQADGGPVAVTDLDIRLFGVRADQATGRGSAIVGRPDGTQFSVAVGEEIVPGVTLQSVRMDGVTILRNGVAQSLFLDQSQPAGVAGGPGLVMAANPGNPPPPPPAGSAGGAAGGPVGGVTAGTLSAEIGASPRIQNGRIDGFTLQPKGQGEAFRAAGLQPGDVLLTINGVRIANADGIAALPDLVARGQRVTIEVERGGQTVPLNVGTAR